MSEKQHSARDFSRRMIYKIAAEYAATSGDYSYRYFCKEYSISKSTFYKILEKAIIESIVPISIANNMANKAKYNSEQKAGKGGRGRSHNHYEYLKKKRATYMLPKSKAIEFVVKYARCDIPKEKFAEKYYIEKGLLNRTILKAIIENWVSDGVVKDLREKSLKYHPGENTIQFWEQVAKFRNENMHRQG
jgi:hypothetical protein